MANNDQPHTDAAAPVTHRRSSWRRFRHVMRQALIPLLLALLAGFLYEAGAARRDSERYAPPGENRPVGSREQHIYCVGTGDPTIVLEAGAGGWSLYWQFVQADLARRTRVCAYDRAGLGWSSPSPAPRTPQMIVEELRQLLVAAEIPVPVVLVGHGLGGYYARVFAALHPDEVAGMALIDALPPEFDADPFADPFQNWRIPAVFGVVRLFAPQIAARLNPDLGQPPADWVRQLLVMSTRPGHLETAAAELSALSSARSLVENAAPLGDKPLLVLTHSRPLPDPQQEARWQAAQAAAAALSSAGRLQVVADSGYLIPITHPRVVISGVGRVFDDVLLMGG